MAQHLRKLNDQTELLPALWTWGARSAIPWWNLQGYKTQNIHLIAWWMGLPGESLWGSSGVLSVSWSLGTGTWLPLEKLLDGSGVGRWDRKRRSHKFFAQEIFHSSEEMRSAFKRQHQQHRKLCLQMLNGSGDRVCVAGGQREGLFARGVGVQKGQRNQQLQLSHGRQIKFPLVCRLSWVSAKRSQGQGCIITMCLWSSNETLS